MSASLGTVVLCLVVAILSRCDGANPRNGSHTPKEGSSTTVRLTAQRNDTGSWTMRFGDYQITIEHRHYNSTKQHPVEDSTWKLKVKHTSTVYQEDPDEVEQETKAEKELSEAINNIIDDVNILEDEVVFIEPVLEPSSSYTAEPFVAGTVVDEEPIIPPINKTTLDTMDITKTSDDNLYDETDVMEVYAIPITNDLTSSELESLQVDEERRTTMDRFPRSRTLIHSELEHEYNYKGYRYYSGVGYVKLNTSHWQWPDARQACEDDGGHLAIPDNKYKISLFTKILKNNSDIIGRAVLKNQVFVGVHDPVGKSQLTTVLGEPFTSDASVWFPNEPNNADPGEDCITLHIEGKLRDVPCFYNLPFLCQIDV